MTTKFGALAFALVTVACGAAVDETDSVKPDASVEVDASVTVDASVSVPDAVSSYDCVPSPREQMGASPDTTATFQIWLDGSALYTCHGSSHPPCPGFGGPLTVYDCRTKDLTGAQ